MGAARDRVRQAGSTLTSLDPSADRASGRQAAVLALQRTAGNRAVQRALEEGEELAGAGAPAGVPDLAGSETAEPLAGGTVTLSFTKSPATFPAVLQSAAATYGDLLVELTAKQAKGEENGRTRPGTPKLTVGGKEASTMADDDVVTSGVLTIADAVELPSWANVASSQPDQQAAWRTYVSEMTTHEDLHVADDKAAYTTAAKTMGGMTVKKAYEAIDAATAAADAQAPVTDAAHPAPTLKQAGTTKVP